MTKFCIIKGNTIRNRAKLVRILQDNSIPFIKNDRNWTVEADAQIVDGIIKEVNIRHVQYLMNDFDVICL